VAALVGTSGWQYADWRGSFYPPETPTRQWLCYYATRFATVEVNNAFYRLPERAVFERWRTQTPAGFVVAVKASRYLTHVRRLHEPHEPVNRLIERAGGLGDKLGPVLLQLPPTLKRELAALDETLAAFPSGVRVAVEPRHDSWFVDDTAELLKKRGAVLCLVDRPGWRGPFWRTADWGYVRFHEGRASPHPHYGRAALRTWAERLAELYPGNATMYAYFNNDTHAAAPRDAEVLTRELVRAGLEVAGRPE
jgi:uncharacterized protein YecE (DUF72 family)